MTPPLLHVYQSGLIDTLSLLAMLVSYEFSLLAMLVSYEFTLLAMLVSYSTWQRQRHSRLGGGRDRMPDIRRLIPYRI